MVGILKRRADLSLLIPVLFHLVSISSEGLSAFELLPMLFCISNYILYGAIWRKLSFV